MARREHFPRPSFSGVLALFALALGTTALVGCSAEPNGETASPSTGAATARSYSVHGIIEQLPDPEQGGVPFLIRHEAIPDFVTAYGKRSGMRAMTMPFELADGVGLNDLQVGDAVAFELSVDWDSAPAMAITAIEKLPPDIALELADR